MNLFEHQVLICNSMENQKGRSSKELDDVEENLSSSQIASHIPPHLLYFHWSPAWRGWRVKDPWPRGWRQFRGGRRPLHGPRERGVRSGRKCSVFCCIGLFCSWCEKGWKLGTVVRKASFRLTFDHQWLCLFVCFFFFLIKWLCFVIRCNRKKKNETVGFVGRREN